MKILFYRYGSICEPDILEAAQELGHTVTIIDEEISNKNISFADTARLVGNSLLSHSQDCVFTINFFRLSPTSAIFLKFHTLAGSLIHQ